METTRLGYHMIWIFVLLKHVLSVDTVIKDSVCYCLKEELTALRNPVHIEPTVLDGEHVYLLAEQLGVIKVYNPTSARNKLKTYIDLSHLVVCKPELYEERGLLGFALHPKFEHNRKLYTYSIRPIQDKNYVVISEITGKEVEKEVKLILIEQPGNRRNGGQLLFGDDGFLYIFVGDGGPAEDRNIQAQNGSQFLGKVLRIDVDKTTVVNNHLQYYDTPQDNPKSSGWRPEVYAVGARNMWRCSKDGGDKQGNGKGRIFCGDLGSSLADELIQLSKGGNYGWPYWEGNICRNNTMCSKIDDLVSPIYEFRRGQNEDQVAAVVGGPLYRGSHFPEIYGHLVYGDYMTGKTFTLKQPSSNSAHSNWTSNEFSRCDKSMCECDARDTQRTMLLSFGQTHDGELLLLMTDEPTPYKGTGGLLKLVLKKSSGVTCGAVLGLPSCWIIFLSCFTAIFIYHYSVTWS